MTREKLSDIIVAVLAVCALTATALLVRREFLSTPLPRSDPRVTTVQQWQEYVSRGDRLGPSDAAVTIVNFSDFQCPFCRTLALSLKELRRKNPSSVAVVFRHYPVTGLHPLAAGAAVAVVCAAEQGKFESYHDLIFQLQDSLWHFSWVGLARRAGVSDTTRFVDCVRSESALARVHEDARAAEQLGIRGTPLLLVNNVRLEGAPTMAVLDSLVENQTSGIRGRDRPK